MTTAGTQQQRQQQQRVKAERRAEAGPEASRRVATLAPLQSGRSHERSEAGDDSHVVLLFCIRAH